MKRLIYIIIISFFVTNTLKAQTASQNKILSEIVLEGETVDSAFLGNPKKNQTVIISVLTTAASAMEAPRIIYNYQLSAQKPFKQVIHPKGKYTYVNFDISKLKGRKKWSNFDNIYILQPGDKIHCRLSASKYFEFSGIGSEKLNCQSAIYEQKYTQNELEKRLRRANKHEDYFNLQGKRLDSILKERIKILDQYAPKIGDEMAEIMLANCYGLRYYLALRNQLLFASKLPNIFNGFIKSEAYKKINFSIPQKISDKALVNAPVYANSILMKIIIDNLLDKNKQIRRLRSKEVTDGVYRDILANYQGILREKLLQLFFYDFKNSMFMANHLTEALSYIKQPEYKDAILEFQRIKAKGSPFYQFELEDDKGDIIKLSDLDKNVVIMDFWYTGCRNCILLHTEMKPIYAKYKNNPVIKFVSISIDKSKETWKHSLKSGLYTDSNQINLYTGGVGSSHPVIENNQIGGYPKMFILKNGKIFSSTPPRLMAGNNEAKKTFIALIENAITEISSK